ncbi:MAG: hypothetical protein J6Y24_06080 [Bacteroidales bacterium]|nr:hypothetical protein [Bacteroidales bacterium]
MKKILSTILTVLFVSITTVFDAAAQENVGGILSEAKTALLNRKCDLLEGRASFESRINTIRDSSNQNTFNDQRISALNSGIRDIDSSIKKIDIALDAINNSNMVNSYTNRVEIGRNGNTVKIYRRVADNSLTVEVNGERILNNDGNDTFDIFDPHIGFNKKNDFKGHLSGIFLGINGLLNSDFKYETPEDYPFLALNETRSLDFSIYFNDFAVPFSKNFGLVSGFALQFNHYSFQEAFDLVVVDRQITADYNTIVPEFKRFNYRIMHFNVPLVFEFCTSGYRKFFVNAGIMGGIRIGSRTKQVYKIDDERQKKCIRKPFETNLLKYSFIGGFGYNGVQIFGEFSPVPLFKDGHGPELYPFSVGIKWVF